MLYQFQEKIKDVYLEMESRFFNYAVFLKEELFFVLTVPSERKI